MAVSAAACSPRPPWFRRLPPRQPRLHPRPPSAHSLESSSISSFFWHPAAGEASHFRPRPDPPGTAAGAAGRPAPPAAPVGARPCSSPVAGYAMLSCGGGKRGTRSAALENSRQEGARAGHAGAQAHARCPRPPRLHGCSGRQNLRPAVLQVHASGQADGVKRSGAGALRGLAPPWVQQGQGRWPGRGRARAASHPPAQIPGGTGLFPPQKIQLHPVQRLPRPSAEGRRRRGRPAPRARPLRRPGPPAQVRTLGVASLRHAAGLGGGRRGWGAGRGEAA